MTQIHRGELSQRERGHLGKQERPSEETGCCQHLGAAGPDPLSSYTLQSSSKTASLSGITALCCRQILDSV